ncbi:LamG domain-containing protein [Nanoarchaeota archaeon]
MKKAKKGKKEKLVKKNKELHKLNHGLGFFGIIFLVLIAIAIFNVPSGLIGFGTQEISTQSLYEDIKAIYPLDNNAQDSTGSNHGSEQGGVLSNQPGIIDESYYFDGNDDYIDINSANIHNINDVITVSAWFNMSSGGDDDKIVSGYPGWELQIRDNYSHFDINGGNGVISGSTNPNYNEWYNIVGVYNGTHVKVYLNGNFEGETEYSSSINNANDVAIGRASNGNYYFNGFIDEVIIWNKALNDSEVSDYYNNNLGCTPDGTCSYITSGIDCCNFNYNDGICPNYKCVANPTCGSFGCEEGEDGNSCEQDCCIDSDASCPNGCDYGNDNDCPCDTDGTCVTSWPPDTCCTGSTYFKPDCWTHNGASAACGTDYPSCNISNYTIGSCGSQGNQLDCESTRWWGPTSSNLPYWYSCAWTGSCNTATETCTQPDNVCGNGYCESRYGSEDGYDCPSDCCVNSNGFCPDGCNLGNDDDCGSANCGNYYCEQDLGENSGSCCQDCGYCGDNTCCTQSGEDENNCPNDCTIAVCGNSQCEQGEDQNSCCQDCGYCGDGNCCSQGGEDSNNCQNDCSGGSCFRYSAECANTGWECCCGEDESDDSCGGGARCIECGSGSSNMNCCIPQGGGDGCMSEGDCPSGYNAFWDEFLDPSSGQNCQSGSGALGPMCAESGDGGSEGDVTDIDGDGILNYLDNCPEDYNPGIAEYELIEHGVIGLSYSLPGWPQDDLEVLQSEGYLIPDTTDTYLWLLPFSNDVPTNCSGKYYRECNNQNNEDDCEDSYYEENGENTSCEWDDGQCEFSDECYFGVQEKNPMIGTMAARQLLDFFGPQIGLTGDYDQATGVEFTIDITGFEGGQFYYACSEDHEFFDEMQDFFPGWILDGDSFNFNNDPVCLRQEGGQDPRKWEIRNPVYDYNQYTQVTSVEFDIYSYSTIQDDSDEDGVGDVCDLCPEIENSRNDVEIEGSTLVNVYQGFDQMYGNDIGSNDYIFYANNDTAYLISGYALNYNILELQLGTVIGNPLTFAYGRCEWDNEKDFLPLLEISSNTDVCVRKPGPAILDKKIVDTPRLWYDSSADSGNGAYRMDPAYLYFDGQMFGFIPEQGQGIVIPLHLFTNGTSDMVISTFNTEVVDEGSLIDGTDNIDVILIDVFGTTPMTVYVTSQYLDIMLDQFSQMEGAYIINVIESVFIANGPGQNYTFNLNNQYEDAEFFDVFIGEVDENTAEKTVMSYEDQADSDKFADCISELPICEELIPNGELSITHVGGDTYNIDVPSFYCDGILYDTTEDAFGQGVYGMIKNNFSIYVPPSAVPDNYDIVDNTKDIYVTLSHQKDVTMDEDIYYTIYFDGDLDYDTICDQGLEALKLLPSVYSIRSTGVALAFTSDGMGGYTPATEFPNIYEEFCDWNLGYEECSELDKGNCEMIHSCIWNSSSDGFGDECDNCLDVYNTVPEAGWITNEVSLDLSYSSTGSDRIVNHGEGFSIFDDTNDLWYLRIAFDIEYCQDTNDYCSKQGDSCGSEQDCYNEWEQCNNNQCEPKNCGSDQDCGDNGWCDNNQCRSYCVGAGYCTIQCQNNGECNSGTCTNGYCEINEYATLSASNGLDFFQPPGNYDGEDVYFAFTQGQEGYEPVSCEDAVPNDYTIPQEQLQMPHGIYFPGFMGDGPVCMNVGNDYYELDNIMEGEEQGILDCRDGDPEVNVGTPQLYFNSSCDGGNGCYYATRDMYFTYSGDDYDFVGPSDTGIVFCDPDNSPGSEPACVEITENEINQVFDNQLTYPLSGVNGTYNLTLVLYSVDFQGMEVRMTTFIPTEKVEEMKVKMEAFFGDSNFYEYPDIWITNGWGNDYTWNYVDFPIDCCDADVCEEFYCYEVNTLGGVCASDSPGLSDSINEDPRLDYDASAGSGNGAYRSDRIIFEYGGNTYDDFGGGDPVPGEGHLIFIDWGHQIFVVNNTFVEVYDDSGATPYNFSIDGSEDLDLALLSGSGMYITAIMVNSSLDVFLDTVVNFGLGIDLIIYSIYEAQGVGQNYTWNFNPVGGDCSIYDVFCDCDDAGCNWIDDLPGPVMTLDFSYQGDPENQTDSDNDGLGDECDLCPLEFAETDDGCLVVEEVVTESSGGSRTTAPCLPIYNDCSEWSSCIGSSQTRTCYDAASCSSSRYILIPKDDGFERVLERLSTDETRSCVEDEEDDEEECTDEAYCYDWEICEVDSQRRVCIRCGESYEEYQYCVPSIDLDEDIEIEETIEVGDQIIIVINDEEHTITVVSIGEDFIIITIESDPFDVKVKIGEVQLVDVDKDGINDISIEAIKVNGKVDIIVTKLEKEKIEEMPSRITTVWTAIVALIVLIVFIVLMVNGIRSYIGHSEMKHPPEFKRDIRKVREMRKDMKVEKVEKKIKKKEEIDKRSRVERNLIHLMPTR